MTGQPSTSQKDSTRSEFQSEGPKTAEIMIVGEAPGQSEVAHNRPFVGASGQELDRMLHEAGILRADCYLTNVCRIKPPNNKIDKFFLKKTKAHVVPGPEIEAGIAHLQAEIEEVKPKLIIALGETALWALTGESGIGKWRGSQLTYTGADHTCYLLPTYHPAMILRQWSWRFIGVLDLRRAVGMLDPAYTGEPEWEFTVRPSFDETMALLDSMKTISGWVSCDLETRAGHIACCGFGFDATRAFCIPFMCIERSEGYWTEAEEKAIIFALREVFSNPEIRWIFQNGLYDVQYISRFWGVVPKCYMDTMLSHHVCWPGLPKGLDFLSSMYCEWHRYWKDDGRNWDPHKTPEDTLWIYNCQDCCATWEVAERLEKQIADLGLQEQNAFQHRRFPAVFRKMLRSVRCNTKIKNDLIFELDRAFVDRQQWIDEAIGHPININSPKQMQEFFYGELNIKPIKNRKNYNRPTTNDEALEKIERMQPALLPLIHRMREMRSISTFSGTYALMPLDIDGRIRCAYNIAGTETFRYNSRENAFGSGGNLQNIPKGGEIFPGSYPLPNIKKMFIPDPGKEIFDADYDRADAQVVAAEANDEELRQMFREGADIHLENAKVIFNNPGLRKDSRERDLAKAGVHATNYGAGVPTLASALGITRHAADRFQQAWFRAHPGIADWHDRVEDQLQTSRMVTNRFGFKRYYFDRIEGVLPEALAWVPQSTVALIVCHGLVNL